MAKKASRTKTSTQWPQNRCQILKAYNYFAPKVFNKSPIILLLSPAKIKPICRLSPNRPGTFTRDPGNFLSVLGCLGGGISPLGARESTKNIETISDDINIINQYYWPEKQTDDAQTIIGRCAEALQHEAFDMAPKNSAFLFACGAFSFVLIGAQHQYYCGIFLGFSNISDESSPLFVLIGAQH